MKKYKSSIKNKRENIKNIIISFFLLGTSIFFSLSFLSFFFHWENDQSQIINFLSKETITENLLGKIGAIISHYFIYYGIGISAIFIPILLFITGLIILIQKKFIINNFYKSITYNFIFLSIWIPITSYFIIPNEGGVFCGVFGFEIGNLFVYLFGTIGSYIILIISMIVYINIIYSNIEKKIRYRKILFQNFSFLKNLKMKNYKKKIVFNYNDDYRISYPIIKHKKNTIKLLDIEKNVEFNKKKIIKILNYYQIKISQINAIIGPTIILYEISPHIGVRISKIKNLEREIALNLSAQSIRIIAPIPGKSTIGIEIPNKKRHIVHINDILFSEENKKKSCSMELPISLGKTIFNENFIVDLTEMPHLLIAGSTGQGKSVGLNAIIIFLLYNKNPEEIKFILIDPKKVELSIYKKISKYYFAMFPNYTGNNVISDLDEIENILDSLCKEMEKRYNILERYKVRNIIEYNKKECKNKSKLPYIILMIDEFADILSYKSKKTKIIEKYLIRLAQLARAVGIHLIIATQRPSVDVITGLIKSNFTARIAFKVGSKIDSITILDCTGAEKLVGKGDLLFSNKNEIIRLQCPFIDSSYIQKIVNYYNRYCNKKKEYFLPNPGKNK
ncbi:DNA translocase FtsK 4TM domain-containing protein [Blattabacterium cuenoti]|uniref:DNA translocase FtsK 4TM domain-containing protein n=1 Tax=Blattabacterium cuenoti TaxID=1653831 RepID=UPI00163C703B|nr:DNA translocase FtsK 4TM domain-containing protein [Blattabacterium cuenoti]